MYPQLLIKCRNLLKNIQHNDVFLLSGFLGSGKTTFVGHFCDALYSSHKMIPPPVSSPSFLTYQLYSPFHTGPSLRIGTAHNQEKELNSEKLLNSEKHLISNIGKNSAKSPDTNLFSIHHFDLYHSNWDNFLSIYSSSCFLKNQIFFIEWPESIGTQQLKDFFAAKNHRVFQLEFSENGKITEKNSLLPNTLF